MTHSSNIPAAQGRLAGRRVLVTGGASGIGLATARLFVAEGARVALLDKEGDAASEQARMLGDHAIAVAADVTEEAAVTAAFSCAADRLGGLDGVVNAAGISFWRALADTSLADWRRVLSINLDGLFIACRAAIPHLREAGGGTIVNLSSGAGLRPRPNFGAYCTSKAGVLMLTETLAMELVSDGVRVNAVCPGPILTPMIERTLAHAADPEAQMQLYLSRIGMGRLGTVEEVAQAILFLSCADSAFTTGSHIRVDGGLPAR